MPLSAAELNTAISAFREKGLISDQPAPVKPSDACGPAHTSATAAGDPNTDIKAAAQSAHDNAKRAAGATCSGSCLANPAGLTCAYVEDNYTATSTRSATAPREWTFTGTSTGHCACE